MVKGDLRLLSQVQLIAGEAVVFRGFSCIEIGHVLCLNEGVTEPFKENRMSSRSLVASTSLGLPIAQMRSVFSADDVERKLHKLQNSGSERDYDSLRHTYQRMLEIGRAHV